MKHSLPTPVKSLLEQADYLGFGCLREAAEYILANVDWYLLLKDVKLKDYERVIINAWREEMISTEVIRCTMKVVPPCPSMNLRSTDAFGGKVSNKSFED